MIPIADEDIIVVERNAPLLEFRLRKLLPDGTTEPYTLDGSPTVEFYVKDDLSATDPSTNPGDGTPFKQTTGITILDTGVDPTDEYSALTIQFESGNLPSPVTRYYRLDITKAGKRETVKKGRWVVQNA